MPQAERVGGQIAMNGALGPLFAVSFVPPSLASLQGGRNPVHAMAFVRLKLD